MIGRVGRRLEVYWGKNLTIVFEKRVDNLNNLKNIIQTPDGNNSKLLAKNSKLFDIIDYGLGDVVYREITPVRTPSGQDANGIIETNDFWYTEEEFYDIGT